MEAGKFRVGVKLMSMPSSEAKETFLFTFSLLGDTSRNLTFFLDLDFLEAGDLVAFVTSSGLAPTKSFWTADLVTRRGGSLTFVSEIAILMKKNN